MSASVFDGCKTRYEYRSTHRRHRRKDTFIESLKFNNTCYILVRRLTLVLPERESAPIHLKHRLPVIRVFYGEVVPAERHFPLPDFEGDLAAMLCVVRDDADRLRDGLERRWGHWTGADEVGEEAHDGLLLWLLLIRVVNLGLRRVRRASVYTRLRGGRIASTFEVNPLYIHARAVCRWPGLGHMSQAQRMPTRAKHSRLRTLTSSSSTQTGGDMR